MLQYSPHRRPGLRRAAGAVFAFAVGLTIVGTLAACTGAPSSPATTAGGTPAGVPSSTATVTSTPTPADPPTPVSLTCDQVVTAQQLYDFNPNYGTDPGYSPKANTNPAAAVAMKGVSCGYLNQTSNAVIEVAIAHPAASAVTGLKDTAATSSHVVPTYGVPPTVEGYFTVVGGIGEVQAFSNGYWVVLRSADFAEPGDPQPLVAAVLGNLPKG
ncbi:iron ABC transporter ATP-binding protein [Rathayibacter soli]|uniref:iron ABC transporter ATP-binding protein n=1 Tax=Rathayibacter soli TaxID=3144168 RepID=UPI0027E50D1A|nr:iron ABC transporter ATP-binding protein [Glaciibacter superstes]